MLYKHTSAPPQVRHRCRNPRCAGKLKIPTINRRDAFCCGGCEAQFYSRRCRVCEALFTQKTERRQVCGRSRCRHELQRHFEQYFGSRYPYARLGHNGVRNPIKPGLKIGTKSGRGWRHVAGPGVAEINLRIPLETTASRTDKAFQAYRQKEASAALFQCTTLPLNVIGGHKFVDAPSVGLSPTPAIPKAPAAPAGLVGDGLEIPTFLRRNRDTDEVSS